MRMIRQHRRHQLNKKLEASGLQHLLVQQTVEAIRYACSTTLDVRKLETISRYRKDWKELTIEKGRNRRNPEPTKEQ